MKRIRLLKVVVQPVFVIDDGDTLTEQPGKQIAVDANGWRQFGETAFGDVDMAMLQAQLDAQEPADETDPARTSTAITGRLSHLFRTIE